MIRASLAASATTTVFTCARASSPRSQPPSGVSLLDKVGRAARAPWISILRRYLLPRLLIPSSFGLPPVVICFGTSPSQAARSRPRPKVSALPIAATSAVAFSGPIPGNGHQQSGGLVRAGLQRELLVESLDASVQLAPFGLVVLDQQPGSRAERDLLCGQQGLEVQLQLAPPLRHDDAALQQEGAQLVDQRRPLAHQPVTRAVKALHVELRLALELDKPHRRPGRRLGDRLRIAVVVLLRLDVGPHVLRRHQPDLVALVAQPAAEVMRPATGLHCHHAVR